MAKKVVIAVDASSATLDISDGRLFLGTVAEVVLEGWKPDEGCRPLITLFEICRHEPVAVSSFADGKLTLDLTGKTLSKSFRCTTASHRRFTAYLNQQRQDAESGAWNYLPDIDAAGAIWIEWSPETFEVTDDGAAMAALQGPKGSDGADGKSAYQLAIENGYSGSQAEWLASLKGDKGERGETGERGQKGDKGERGDFGPQGSTGPQGPKGDKGERGESVILDNTVTETSQNGVKSSGIWSWVKSLLPRWLTRDYAEPATVASVTVKADKSALEAHVTSTKNPHAVTAEQVGAYTKTEVNTKLDAKANKATTLSGYGITDAATTMDKSELDMRISNLTYSVDGKLDKQYGNASIGWDDSLPGYFRIKNAILDLYTESGGTYGIQIGGNTLLGDVWQLSSTLSVSQKIQFLHGAQLTFLDDNWNEIGIEDLIKQVTSLSPLAAEYSTSSAYSVGQYVFHDGNIYRCTTAIALPGEAWNPSHWSEAQKLDDFFTESNGLLNGRLAYNRNTTGLKDRAFNALTFDGTEYNLSTALAAVTPTASGQPRDLLIVATATAATTISFTAGTIKGDKPTIDGAGTWLITLTEYAENTWYCRQIKMEDAQ